MKRFLLPLLLLLLTACSPQSLSGQVTEVITGPDGTLTALVIETDAHEERGLLITGGNHALFSPGRRFSGSTACL